MSATDLGDPDQVIHIPARDLTGRRDEKLADLDLFLAQLQVVRLALCGQARVECLDLRPARRGWRLRDLFVRVPNIRGRRGEEGQS